MRYRRRLRRLLPPPARKNSTLKINRSMRGRGFAGTRFLSENFLKEVFRHLSRTFPNEFLLCDGVSVVSGLRYCRLPSRLAKALPALAKKTESSFGKVLVKLFQKLARSRASSPWRAPQSAKFSYRRFFLIDFSLRLLLAKKNRLWSAESNTGARLCGGRNKGVSQMQKCIWYSPPTFLLCG